MLSMEAKVGLRLISWHKDIMHQYYQSPKTKDSSDCFLLNSEVNTWTKVHIGPTNSYLMFVYLVWTWKYIIIISIIKSFFLSFSFCEEFLEERKRSGDILLLRFLPPPCSIFEQTGTRRDKIGNESWAAVWTMYRYGVNAFLMMMQCVHQNTL